MFLKLANIPAPTPIVPKEPSLDVTESITLITPLPKSTIPFKKSESRV